MLLTDEETVRQILLTQASFIGTDVNPRTDEAPGKCMHECTPRTLHGQPLSGAARKIRSAKAEQWGETDGYVINWGSVDATPLFVSLLSDYVKTYGADILDQPVQHFKGENLPMEEVLERAVSWITSNLCSPKNVTGLLTFKTGNPEHGLIYQAWSDSREYGVHADGTGLNYNDSIAATEVQGLAYDALLGGAELLPDQSTDLRTLAKNLQTKTLALTWMPPEQYFALGMDFDETGLPRQIRTRTALPAQLLDTRIFDDLPKAEREMYVSGIVRQIFNDDFLTDAGARCRALSQAELIPFADYHGSYAVWPKLTKDIASGLQHQGLAPLGHQLALRCHNVMARGGCRELFFVDGENHVFAGEPGAPAESAFLVESTNIGEKDQTWSWTAYIHILHQLSGHNPSVRLAEAGSWQQRLTNEVLSKVKTAPYLQAKDELQEYYPDYPFHIMVRNPLTKDFFLDRLHEVIQEDRRRSKVKTALIAAAIRSV